MNTKTEWNYLTLKERERMAYAQGDVEMSRLLCKAMDESALYENDEGDEWEEQYHDAIGALQEIGDILSHFDI